MERIHLFMTNDNGKTFNKIDGNKFKESTVVESYKRENRNSWEGFDWCKRTIQGKTLWNRVKKQIEESIHTRKKDRTFVSVWIDSIDKDKSCYGKYYFCFNYTANELVQYFEDLEKQKEEKRKAEEEKRKAEEEKREKERRIEEDRKKHNVKAKVLISKAITYPDLECPFYSPETSYNLNGSCLLTFDFSELYFDEDYNEVHSKCDSCIFDKETKTCNRLMYPKRKDNES